MECQVCGGRKERPGRCSEMPPRLPCWAYCTTARSTTWDSPWSPCSMPFAMIAVLDLGAPTWLVVSTGVIIAVAGHFVLRRAKRALREPPGGPAPSKRQVPGEDVSEEMHDVAVAGTGRHQRRPADRPPASSNTGIISALLRSLLSARRGGARSLSDRLVVAYRIVGRLARAGLPQTAFVVAGFDRSARGGPPQTAFIVARLGRSA